MADLGFLPGVTPPARHDAARAASGCCSPPRSTGRRRPGQALPDRPGDAQRRLGAVAGRHHDPPRAARRQGRAGSRCWSTWPPHPVARSSSRAPSTARRALARQLNQKGVPADRAARQPVAERPHPQPRRVLHRHGDHAGGHRHRGARHPRRRRRPRRARRPAGRAQGVPAPLRPYGARRQRGHRRDPDAGQPGLATYATWPARPGSSPRSPASAPATRCSSRSPPASARSSPRRRCRVRAANDEDSRGGRNGGASQRRRRPQRRWRPERRRRPWSWPGQLLGRVEARRRQPHPRWPRPLRRRDDAVVLRPSAQRRVVLDQQSPVSLTPTQR